MELPEGLRLVASDRPAAADCERIGLNLDRYNREFLGETGFSRIGLFIKGGNGEIRAGLAGSTYAGWLHVADLWVDADLRGRGIGGCLLAMAEREAIARGCHSAMLDTFSFQAPEFYPRFGYRAYARLGYAPAHQRIFLRKQLLPGGFGGSTPIFPVSIKGVLFEADRVVLLENERSEWELPGGRLEEGVAPESCLAREIAEELGAEVAVETILDSWLYRVRPEREVVIVTYGVRRTDREALRASAEHRRLGRFALGELDSLALPEGYRRSIRSWAAQCGLR
jgi:8-oxo-dGTP pyrophosphatase MutT (NUDIX family)/GNAT superfamily N-acetyltransferase